MNKILSYIGPIFLALVAFLSLSLVSAQAKTTIGVGAGVIPKYEGAKKYKTQLYPSLSYEKDNFFIGPKLEMPAAGLQAHLADNWKVGVFGAYTAGRKSRKDSHLYGMRNISQHATAGVFSKVDSGDFSFNITYFHALKEGYGGGLQVGGAYKLMQTEASALRIGSTLSWADNDAMDTNFGVSAGESRASGGRLNAYEASSGLRSVSIYSAYHHQLSSSWSVNSSIGIKRLTADAADSPITQRKASVYGGVGLGYSF